MGRVSAVVKGVGRVFFPDTMTERQIAESLASKGQELLDISSAARLGRAKAQGFGGGTLFRGSETAEGISRPFVHTSKSSDVANSFGGFVQAAEDLGIPQFPLEGGNVAQLVDRATNTATMTDIKKLPPSVRADTVQDAFPELQRMGFDSFEDSGQRVIFNPEDVRSVNAAFDPARSKSSDLLASVAPVGLGLGALAGGEDATASTFASRANETPTEKAARLLVRPEDKITSDEFPNLEAAGDFLDKWATTPLGPAFEGISKYLRDFGREDVDGKQRAKAAFIAALDLI